MPDRHFGFTLIELLVVITIIVVLLAMLVPALDRAIYQAGLVACGAQLDGVAMGAIRYSFDHKRYYPRRPTLGNLIGSWEGNTHFARLKGVPAGADGTKDTLASDDRPIIQGYIDLKMFLDPLAAKVDLSPQGTANSDSVEVPMNLYYGWQYRLFQSNNPNSRYLSGMFKLGDQLMWIEPGGPKRTFKFNLLASDCDMVNTVSGDLWNSHPDDADVTHNRVLQNEVYGGGAGGPTDSHFTLSRWDTNFGTTYQRGLLDNNFAFDDGSVRRYNGVRRSLSGNFPIYDHDERMGTLPVWSWGGAWQEAPQQAPATSVSQ